MAGYKHRLDDDGTSPEKKTHKRDSVPSTSAMTLDAIDFPRGGGSTLTPLEAVREADQELFDHQVKPKQRKSDVKGKATEVDVQTQDTLRIEHLNYKRLMPGMRVLGQVMSIQPLAIVVSLPNQLFAHVPITQITSQLTHRLESTNDDEDEELDDNKSESSTQVPDLTDLFYVGQYVRAAVISTHPPGTTDMAGLGRVRDDAIKASRRVELSLLPEKVNVGVRKADLKIGYSLNAAVRSIEDHGYLLELGISGVSGFLSFKEAHKGDSEGSRLQLGALIHVSVIKMSSNGRICTLTNDSDVLASSSISEVTNVASVLPGSLVQSLVTAVVPGGLNLQILGFFDATADEFHLPSTHSSLKVGKKVKARVLYDLPTTTPPRFVALHTAFPVGTVLEAVTVRQVEAERGLLVEVQPGQEGFVHISHVSDEHIPNLSASSGPWGPNTLHKARVIGHHPFDGILQLSLRSSVLEQRFIQAGQVQVGEVLKGIVKRLTDSALFVSISGNVDGVIWPVHYADIPLKHPSKKFKVGGNIKCRVLTVDPERNRVVLTAKKTLLDTTFPILTSFSDAKAGFLTHAVVFRVTDKYLMVEFFNNVKAVVPAREASETGAKLTDIYAPGKVIKVRVISVQPEAQRIVASIRQATSSFTSSVTDISGVLIGDTVEGVVTQLHKLNVVLSLKPSDVRALISFSGLARHWNTTVPELKTLLKPGASIGSLAVVSRNPEKGFVVVTGYSKSDQQKKVTLSMDNVIVGQIVLGRITKYARFGAHIKLTTRISGSLHPTDTSDDYEAGNTFPAVDSILRAAVQPVDREINSIDDLKAGDTVRGFIKSVAEHGLFVMLGRGIDARVQIRELFDEYIKDWKSRFVVNQLVRGRILNIDTANKKVEMTFRSGDLTRAPSNSLTLSDLREGQKVAGRVKRIEQYGIFIGIEGSKISGLCHKSQLSDNKDADVTIALRTFREGDRVRAFIISRDLEKKQLSLGLKPSYFAGDDDEVVSDSEHPQENKLGVTDNVKTHGSDLGEDHPQDSGSDEEELVTIGDGHDDDDDRDDIMEVDGFQWFKDDAIPYEQSSQSESSDQSDGEEGSVGRKKRKRRKEIETDVTADMQTKMPDSNADFERRLLGSPNSSYLWIQYMSFQLQLSEIDKARAIGKRAIQTIHFREEQEKLNVWIALLNLENVYGTDATMETVFKDAMRYNDSKTIHLRLAAIFDESQKYEKAEDQYKRTCKKFGQSSKVWTLFCEHYLRRGQVEDARKLLSRSLQSLEKRKHIKTISKFAQLEYKLGDVERGRTIFEGIVDSHPKRWDIWSVYMDMEARNGDIQHLRAFFKKWLDLERKLGDEEGATAVKQKAVEWTQMAAEVA
ncbi:hypothetical protein EV363DRAFT_1393337 [Boletus edulis]|nr:hypothetical protein EV363DRAFT_1393337 [Boletus edulis]